MRRRRFRSSGWIDEAVMTMLVSTAFAIILSAILERRLVPTPGAATMSAAAQAEAEGSHLPAPAPTVCKLAAVGRILIDPDSDGRPDLAVDERHDTGDTGK